MFTRSTESNEDSVAMNFTIPGPMSPTLIDDIGPGVCVCV